MLISIPKDVYTWLIYNRMTWAPHVIVITEKQKQKSVTGLRREFSFSMVFCVVLKS